MNYDEMLRQCSLTLTRKVERLIRLMEVKSHCYDDDYDLKGGLPGAIFDKAHVESIIETESTRAVLRLLNKYLAKRIEYEIGEDVE